MVEVFSKVQIGFRINVEKSAKFDKWDKCDLGGIQHRSTYKYLGTLIKPAIKRAGATVVVTDTLVKENISRIATSSRRFSWMNNTEVDYAGKLLLQEQYTVSKMNHSLVPLAIIRA